MIDKNRVYDFTVIVPCHNSAGLIMPLLHTLAMQDVSDMRMQYVFVCDNCSDNTKSVLDDYVDMIHSDRTEIVTCNHGRAGLARNEGLEIALGKYIVFLDSDDNLIRPDFFKIIHKAFEEYPEAEAVLFNFVMNDMVLGTRSNNGAAFPAAWSRCLRRETIGDTRFNDQTVGEDLTFAQAIFAKKPKCIDIGRTMIWYNYPREGSLASEWEKAGRE